MIKFRIFNGFVLASLLLGACASPGVAPGAGSFLPTTPGGEKTALGVSPANSPFFDVLVGEFAGQRGQLSLAASHFLAAAEATQDPRIAERATRYAFLASDVQSGLVAARLWVTLQPSNNDAHQSLAIFLLHSGDTPGSLAELEELINNLRPNGPEAAYGLVAALLAQERNQDTAIALMHKLVERAERSRPEALFALGRLELQANQPARAIASLDEALRVRPKLVGAIVLRARALQMQGKRDNALHYLADAAKGQPHAAALRLAYGRALIDAARFDEARAEFILLAHQEPKNADILFALGVLFLQASQDDAAKQQFLQMIALHQRVAEASFYLGQIAEAHNLPAEAIKWYRSVRSGDNALDAQIRLAVLLARQGDLIAARDHLHAFGVSDTAQAVRLVLVESDLLTDAGRLVEAMDLLSKALQELPENADLLYARAMIAERRNDISVLEQDLTTILATDPNHVQALNALGFTLADRSLRLPEALQFIQRALALRPKDFYILDSMGWVQYRLGNHTKSVRYLRQALAQRDDPEVAAHLGEVLWVSGNHREARKVWAHALKRNPTSKVVREAMDRFIAHTGP